MITPGFNIDTSSVNAIKAKVELYNGSTLVKTCTCSDVLQSFTVDRDEENSKFFGFGVCQSTKALLIDLERTLNIAEGYIITPSFGDGTNFINPYPTFYAKEITRDEDTNALTIVAYDKLYDANAHTIEEVGLTTPYSIFDVANKCAQFLGLSKALASGIGSQDTSFGIVYADGANFGGQETIRQVLDAIAEVTQTVYYINKDNELIFKRLDKSGLPVFTITKDAYFSLSTGAKETIAAICSATELGDNISTEIGGTEGGTTQYIRDNPFWDLRDDRATLVTDAWARVNGLEIHQFVCDSWEGNFLLEIGDKIGITTEDGQVINSFVLNDSILFDGTMEEATYWTYEPNDNETAANPTSLGERLNQTYAKVDKANKTISLVAAEASGNSGKIAALELNTSSMSLSVKSIEETTSEQIGGLNENIAKLSKEVALKLSEDDVKITIEEELADGVEKVKTSTGFTFDSEGLKVSKSDSEISTLISEDGMTISKSGTDVLVANNQGVQAEDLHATTYLIIGENSRIEDWDERTACFWIGG